MARDSGGTMSLAKPPFVAGTASSAPDVNTVLSDIATELTDSLSRSGKGGLLSPLKFADGALATPVITFTSEPSSGFYRVATNILAWVIAGVERVRATSTGVSITGTLGLSGATTSTADLNTSASVVVDLSAANGGVMAAPALRFGGSSTGEGLASKRTAGGNQFGLELFTNSVSRISISNAGAVTVPGTLTSPNTFVVAGHVRGSDGVILSQTGSITATCSHDAGGTYTVTAAGVTTSAIVVLTGHAGSGVGTTAVLGSGTFAVLLRSVSTGLLTDGDFSFEVIKL